MLIQGVGPRVFQILEDPGTGVKVTASPGLQKQTVSAGLGQRRRWFQDRSLRPLSTVFLEDSSGGWGVGRSGSLVCGSMVRYGRELAILIVHLQNITESIAGMDFGEFDSFTVRIYGIINIPPQSPLKRQSAF